MPQKTTDKVVTKKYLDRKLDEMFDKKLKPYTTKDHLDERLRKNTEEIIDVISEGFNTQGQILQDILEEVKSIKLDQRTHNIRLNDHDVRIEKLEKSVN